MLLTRDEQEKLQLYVIKNMIENQQAIRAQFNDYEVDFGLQFIDYMIEKKYKQAFDLICANFNVYDSFIFMSHILYYFYPNIVKEQAKYNIFVQTNTSDDFEIFDKLVMNENEKYSTLSHMIFD